MKHTPLPWSIGGDGADIFGPDMPQSTNEHIADCQPENSGLLGMSVLNVTNTAFIALACNSHYELLEALKHAVAISDYNSPWANKAREAIKKAEG